MSKSNESNRPSVVVGEGAVASTVELAVLYASKKMVVKSLKVIDIDAITANDTNYMSYQALVDGSAEGDAVTTKITGGTGDLAAREAVSIGSDITLEAGELLSVSLTVAAAGAMGHASVHADVEVVGN